MTKPNNDIHDYRTLRKKRTCHMKKGRALLKKFNKDNPGPPVNSIMADALSQGLERLNAN